LSRRPILARIADALTAFAGGPPPAVPGTAVVSVAPAPGQRAIVGNGLEVLNPPIPSAPGSPSPSSAGAQGVAIVRGVSPTEYRRDGATIRRQGFQRHPVVSACFRVITDQVATVPLVVLTRKDDPDSRVGAEHPLQRLLDFPAPRVTARQLRVRFSMDLLGYGNAIWRIGRRLGAGGGRPLTLRPLNPEAVQSVWVDGAGDPARWAVSDWNGRVLNLDVANVLHFRDLELPRPFQPDVFGYPRGAAAIASMIADSEATAYVRQTVTNDGTPTFAVLLDEHTSPGDAEAMRQRYVERQVARGARGTPSFFGGVKDIRALGFTLTDLEFPDLRRVSREDICAVYGVDPRMIGIASATRDTGLSGAQYAEARSRLIQHTVEPLLSLFTDELNAWLSPEFGNVWIDYDREVLRDLVENDDQTSTRIRAELSAGLRSWEESRIAIRLSPRPAPTDSIMLGLGTTLVPAATAVINPADILDDGEEEEETPEADVVEEETPRTAPTRTRAEEDPRFAAWRAYADRLDAEELPYRSRARSLFRAEGTAVAAIFAEAEASTARTRAAVNDPILAAARARATAEYRPGGSFWETWARAYERLVGPTYLGGAGMLKAEAALSFSLQSPAVQAAITARAERLATLVGEDTARAILAAVRSGELGGFSIREIGRLVQATVFGEHVSDVRATRIARTESAGAMSQGQWDQAAAAGIYRSKEWLAFDDSETRATHSACMAEGRIPIDQPFAANGLQFPLDPSGNASEVINCRCSLLYYDEPASPE
jgi:HK97 family phage portal protein